MGVVPTQNNDNTDNQSSGSVSDQLNKIREQIADTPVPDKDAPVEDRREFKETMAKLSKQAAALRIKEIDADDRFDDKEKQILKLYNKGIQAFAIAKEVYDFANSDTVGKVMITIRKAHADDFDEVEDINSTKGYTGVGLTT